VTKKHLPAFGYIGFGSVLSQIILIRECMVSFYGNELGIGICLAGWLFWTGTGSLIADRIVRTVQDKTKWFYVLLMTAPATVWIQVLLIRFAKPLLDTPAGEYISLTRLTAFSFMALGLGSPIWGMLFTFGSAMASSLRGENASGIKRVYIAETLGSVLGGLLFTFVLVSRVKAFQSISLNLMAGMVLGWNGLLGHRASGPKAPRPGWRRIPSMGIPALLMVAGLFPQLETSVDRIRWRLEGPKMTLLESRDTKYQNLSLLGLDDQVTIFSDGKPAVHIPDTENAETFAHLVMVHSDDPKRVLLIGGTVSGLVRELLKYGIDSLDCVEIDPELVRTAEPFLPDRDRTSLHDSRVRWIHQDGRAFLERTKTRYDAILLNPGIPSTVGQNRFFTLEFFRVTFRRLNPDGIVAFPFPSSADYLGEEMKRFNATIAGTFNAVFSSTLLIPGTNAIWVGSKSRKTRLCVDPDSLSRKFVRNGIPCDYFSEALYTEHLAPDRIAFVESTLRSVTDSRLNTDDSPIAYYHAMLLWNKFLKGDSRIFERLNRVSPTLFTAAVALALICIFFLNWKNPEKRVRAAMNIAMGIGGMSGMVLSLFVMMRFQIAFGSIYESVGALIAANMVGMALGSVLMPGARNRFGLAAAFAALLLLVLSLPWILKGLTPHQPIGFSFLLMTGCGAAMGALFTSINAEVMARSNRTGNAYAFDLIGSSLGALMAGSLLLPVFGFKTACITLAALLSVVSVLSFVSFWKK